MLTQVIRTNPTLQRLPPLTPSDEAYEHHFFSPAAQALSHLLHAPYFNPREVLFFPEIFPEIIEFHLVAVEKLNEFVVAHPDGTSQPIVPVKGKIRIVP